MPKFRFSCGDSSKGPIGFAVDVEADTKEAALEKLEFELSSYREGFRVPLPNNEFSHFVVFFNAEAITLDDIVEVQVYEPPKREDFKIERMPGCYMLFYKNQPIGGLRRVAAYDVSRVFRHTVSQPIEVKDDTRAAELDKMAEENIQDLLKGGGRADMRERINEIGRRINPVE